MKKRRYIYAGISVLFMLGSLTIFYFLYKAIESHQATIDAKQEEWQAEEDRRNEIKNLERTVKTLEDKRIKLESHFVSGEDPVNFLNHLEDLARSVGGSAEVSTVDLGKENKSLTVSLKATGSFDAMYRFITLLENSEYKMEIKNLVLQSSDTELIKGSNIKKWSLGVDLKLLTFSVF